MKSTGRAGGGRCPQRPLFRGRWGPAPLSGGLALKATTTALGCLCAAVVVSASPIRLAGSDHLGPAFATAAADYARHNGVEVATALTGSRPGIFALENGQADCALFFLPPGEKPPTGFHARPIGALFAGVFVAEANSVRQLTLAQVRAVYGAGGPAPVKWGDLGGIQAWAERPIVALAYAPRDHLALEVFRHAVLGPAGWRTGLMVTDDLGACVRAVTTSPHAIYVAPINQRLPQWRALALSVDGKKPSLPVPEVITTGSYPLQMTLYLGFHRRDAPALLTWLRFLLSEDSARALAPAGIILLPADDRNRLALELEQMR